MSPDPASIALRVTVIAGTRYADDYTVIWRGLSIGRIMKGSGVPSQAPQWWWGCNVYGKPGASGNGTGVDRLQNRVQGGMGTHTRRADR